MIGHGALQKVKDWEYEDPDKVHQMPEEAGDFDSVAELLGIGVEQFRSALDGQPEINEANTPRQNVRTVETGDHEVSG